MGKTTLTQIGQKLDDMKECNKERFDRIDTHFDKLNSQTEKNTNFRHRVSAIGKTFMWLMGSGGAVALVVFVVNIIK